MLNIDYPKHNYRIKKEGNKDFIFDDVRCRWVALTPEEWVRQNFLQYLMQIKNYPRSLFAVEKLIKLGELKKRCDIVVYKHGLPWMIVECKEINKVLEESVLEQILRYNMALAVEFLVITNGNNTLAYKLHENTVSEINDLPAM